MIQKLDQNLSEYIKSQQYIHSTYTIVKELVENSLDAKSKTIKITVEKSQITVDDNGHGIENLKNIGKEHYTSKENTSYSALGLVDHDGNELDNGYRGIALSAIRHLCDLEMTTKHRSNNSAFKKTFINGNADAFPEKSIRNEGTFVKVFNIFRDCQIRRIQNEKSMNKNVKMIKDLLESYACVYDVHIVFFYKGKQILNIKGHRSLEDYISKTFQSHLKSSLIRDTRTFYFFMLPFTENNPTSKLFLNRRVVNSTKISKMIKDTYNMFNEGRPTFFLNIKDAADYNISPDKTEFIIKNEDDIIRTLKDEIRRFFRNQVYIESKSKDELTNPINDSHTTEDQFSVDTYQEMFNEVTVVKNRSSLSNEFELEDTLISTEDIPASEYSKDFNNVFSSPMLKKITARLQSNVLNEKSNNSTNPLENTFSGYLDSPKSDKFQNSTCDKLDLIETAFTYLKFVRPFTDDVHITKTDFLKMKVIGQFNKGFILTSLSKDNRSLLLLIDQHAADEIYNYEYFKLTMKINKQKLLIPIKLCLSPIEEIYLQDNLDTFEKWGFEIKDSELLAVPHLDDVLFGMEDFKNIFDNLKNDQVKFDRLHDIFATKACRSSVMIGEGLTYHKMCSIVQNLGRIVNPWKCPHGRPTFVILKDV